MAAELETWAATDYSFRLGSDATYDNGGMASPIASETNSQTSSHPEPPTRRPSAQYGFDVT